MRVVLYLTHEPAPPLDVFVENLWSFSDAPPHARERIVPNGTFELVINLDEDEIRVYESIEAVHFRRYRGAVVSGAFRRSFVVDTREHASIIGVHFKPGGAYPFLGARADDLAGGHVELEAIWPPRDVDRLRERLCACVTAERRFRLLEEALLARLGRPVRRWGAVGVALDLLSRRNASVTEVAERVGLSHRRFIEVFSAEVGMTPKLFVRVRRFQQALALAKRRAEPTWAQLALSCGYFDQSHLIRDFLEFAAITPAQYARHRSERVKDGHVALLGPGSNFSNTQASIGRRVNAGGSDAFHTRERSKA
jgi:AraC-like DNA-binding protein